LVIQNSNITREIIKLFISDDDFKKLNIGDSFYLSRINKDYILSTLTDDQKILLPQETRYLLGYYLDSELSPNNKILVSLKTKFDNNYKTYISYSNSLPHYNNSTKLYPN
jgi:hypothetical protein